MIHGVSKETVWKRVNTWQGVNYELGPLVQMSVPAEFPQVSDIPADGKNHFSSQVLLMGVVPIDRHQFGLRAIDSPNYFDERSENKMMRVWTHKRSLIAVYGGVVVTDRCGFEPRLAVLGGLLLAVYRTIFYRRHRRLTGFFDDKPGRTALAVKP